MDKNTESQELQAFLNDYCNEHSDEETKQVRSVALCAQAMGLKYRLVSCNKPCHTVRTDAFSPRHQEQYYPLEIDEQAMALVKRFMMKTDAFAMSAELPSGVHQDTHLTFSEESLNHAIVECVAQYQAQKVFNETSLSAYSTASEGVA